MQCVEGVEDLKIKAGFVARLLVFHYSLIFHFHSLLSDKYHFIFQSLDFSLRSK